MRIKIFGLLIAFVNIGWAQTEKHIKIAGTKYSLIPPVGFTPATNFSGFQNTNTGASIMIVEIPGPFEAIREGFTADALKAKGMTLLEKQAITFNNAEASYLVLSQPANGTIYLKQILVFGDSKKTVMVNGIYPEASKSSEGEIKNSLFSTSYNADQNDNPLDAVKFTVDISGTDLKFAKYMAGSVIYTPDGKIPTEKPSFIVANSIAKVIPDNQQQYSLDRLKKLPRGEFSVVKTVVPIQIDHLNGYEIVAEGKTKEGKDELIYQVMLFDSTGDYFVILGTAKEDFDKNLIVFKSVAKTFRRK